MSPVNTDTVELVVELAGCLTENASGYLHDAGTLVMSLQSAAVKNATGSGCSCSSQDVRQTMAACCSAGVSAASSMYVLEDQSKGSSPTYLAILK
jgi:hypothetical protein